MVVETKKTPKVTIKENTSIIYIVPDILKRYVDYFSRPGGEIAAELINSIVTLVEELYMPEHCSLEPVNISEDVLKIKFKVLRPEVRLRSENGLFITLRGFYTEHTIKFIISNSTDANSVTVTMLKNIKGSLLNPTLAQATASFAHSHLHSKSFNSINSYEPSTFCLGSSSLSNSLYGDCTVSDTEYKERDIKKALGYISKVLHYTESLVHHESISGTPYNYLRNVIEKTWIRSEDNNELNLRVYFNKAYYECLTAIYNDIITNVRLPFTFGPPLTVNQPQDYYSTIYRENYMPKVYTDEGFIEFLMDIIKPITAVTENKLWKEQLYKFNTVKFQGHYKSLGSDRLCAPANIWSGKIGTSFKGARLEAGYKGIVYDGEGKQTTPKLIVRKDYKGNSDIIAKYIAVSFDLAFRQLIGILLSSFNTLQLLENDLPNPGVRIFLDKANLSPHFNVIQYLIRNADTAAKTTEIVYVLSLLIRSTINFNNFNNFLNDK